MTGSLFVFVILAFAVLIVFFKLVVVVPQQSAYVVERLGNFHSVLSAGFHVLVPFIDVIRYKHSLKETPFDIPEQICITRDNVQVAVDGIIYLRVLDPQKASYGISNYTFAIIQLSQTALRSEIGKIELDRTFEERTHINIQVVTELDKASEPWGVKVERVQMKNVEIPPTMQRAMAQEAEALREKRARLIKAEAELDAAEQLRKAAEVIMQNPAGLELRRMQMITEVGAEQNTMTIVMMPSEFVAMARGIGELARTGRAE